MATRQRRLGLARITIAMLALGMAALPISCGGSSSPGGSGSASSSGESRAGGSSTGSTQRVATAPRSGSKAAAAGVPTSKGGDNSIQTWGVEGGDAERARVTRIVRAFLDARARRAWRRACRYLAAKQRRTFERLAKGQSGAEACATGMALLARGVPTAAFAREAAIDEVLSLRRGGGYAFLIYRQADGTVYARAVQREGGAWKVISVGPTKLE